MSKPTTPMSEGFQPPEVEPGDFVLWSQDRNADPAPAICTAVGHNSIECTIFFPRMMGYTTANPRHIDDPDVKSDDIADEGLWRHGPMRARLLALEEQVRELSLTLAGDKALDTI